MGPFFLGYAKGMHRRTFLASIPLGLATACTPKPEPAQLGQRILVVGAGVAGLTCARELRSRGHQVELFEASERIGGRLFSLQTSELRGIDLGATFLHGGESNPLARLGKSQDVILSPFEHALFDIYRPVRESVYEHRYDWSSFEELLERELTWPSVLAYLKRHTKLPYQLATIESAVRQAFLSWEGSPLKNKITEQMIVELFSQSYGVDLEKLSIANLHVPIEVDTAGYGPFPTGELVAPWGLSSLLPLLQGEQEIKFGRRVLGVSRETDGRFRVRGNFPAEVFDIVIMAVPLGVLKAGSIEFEFELPHAWKRAFENLSLSHLSKVVLGFEKAFWDRTTPSKMLMNKQGQAAYMMDYHFLRETPQCVFVDSGSEALRVEGLSLEQAAREKLEFLKGVYGDQVSEPTEVYKTDWSRQRDFMGSFSHLGVQAYGGEHEVFQQALLKNFWFIGEFAHRSDPGTLQAAFWSGQKLARQLLGL